MLGDKIKELIEDYDDKFVMKDWYKKEIAEELKQLLEYKEKCEGLKREYQMSGFADCVNENKQLKEDALLGKAYDLANTKGYEISIVSGVRIIFKDGESFILLEWYKQQLEKEGSNES